MKRIYEFTVNITDTELSTLIANPEGKILFSTTDADHTTGYVNKININVNTLETNFNLQTE